MLFRSDEYIARQILEVYDAREKAEEAIQDQRFEKRQPDGYFRLVCRQGEPKYEIVEKVVR